MSDLFTEDELGPCEISHRRPGTNGYPYAYSFGRETTAHRAAWEQRYGRVPSNLDVCHKCDNRCCVNLEHLFVGTRQDNVDDMIRKGRNRKGEAVTISKLTESSVREIRRLYANREATQDALAARYGVTQATVWAAITRRTWAHVT